MIMKFPFPVDMIAMWPEIGLRGKGNPSINALSRLGYNLSPLPLRDDRIHPIA
jgi:hypothetical protein